MRSKFKWIFTLLLAFSMQFSFAQEKTITGVVSDASGPLPGASVVVKGTTRGTQTDFDGKYSISASAGETLVVTFVGYNEFSVVVGASNTVNATLVEGVQLGEVMVEGAVGIRRRADAVTSSFQVTSGKEISQAASPNVVQGLIGKVSGLQINTTSSSVNSDTRIQIRGAKSMTGDTQALVVIDGAISSASVLNALAPEVVESVTTLKGAQGAALYGSQGVNGVLIVTTKRGTGDAEKLTVSVNSAIDFQTVAYLPQRQTRYGQGWDGQHYSFENGAWGPLYDGSMQPVGLPQADGSYIMSPYVARDKGGENIRDFFNTGVLQQYGVTLSAGNAKSYNMLAINKQNREFVVGGDVFDRSGFLFKAGREVGKFFFEGNVNYNSQRTDQANGTLYNDLLQTAPNVDLEQFKNTGNEGNYSYYSYNPYWRARNNRSSTRSDLWNASAKIRYTINENINVSYLGNIRSIQNNSLSFVNGYVDPHTDLGGTRGIVSSFSTYNQNSRAIYGDLLVNFDYMLTDAISLKANLGNNITDTYSKQTTVGGSNLVIPGLYNASNVTGTPNATNTFSRERSYAFFANVDLSYKEYLNLNLTSRYEVNSYLPKENNDYFYPSAGLSFIPTKAFDMGEVVTYAKVYANITRVGKAGGIGAYSLNNLYGTVNSNVTNGGTSLGMPNNTGYPFGNLPSFIQRQNTTDPNIKPEFYTTKEIGFSLVFFGDRLSLDASAYRSDNKDLISEISTSSASGVTSALVNIGSTKTEGFEIDLGFTPIKTEDFRWDNKLSLSVYKTEVLKVSDQSNSIELNSGYSTGGIGFGIFAEVGESFPIIKGTAYERDDQGRVIIDAETGNPLYSQQFQNLGNVNPDYILGMNSSIEYKGLRLSATMDYRTGGYFYSNVKSTLATFGYLTETAQDGRTGFVYPNAVMTTSVPGVYTENTATTGGPTTAAYASYYGTQYSNVAENFVLDATAFKVRELALSYSIPAKMLENTGVQSLQVGVNARNPFTVLPKSNNGYSDPESASTTGSGAGFANNNLYPPTRTLGFSLNLTF